MVEVLRMRGIGGRWAVELEFQLEVGNGVGGSSLRSERNGRGREQKWARLCFRTEGCSHVGFAGCVARRAQRGVAAQGGGVLQAVATEGSDEAAGGEFRGLRLTARGPSRHRGCSSAWRRHVA